MTNTALVMRSQCNLLICDLFCVSIKVSQRYLKKRCMVQNKRHSNLDGSVFCEIDGEVEWLIPLTGYTASILLFINIWMG